MVQERQWISIDECINAYLSQSEQGVSKYSKCWQLAFDGMNQMGLDIFYQIKSVKLPVNSNKTVYLPSDYLNYNKIGILNNNGEVIPLRYNNKLTLYADLRTDRVEKTEDNSLLDLYSFTSPIFYNYWNGYQFTNLYGVPSGYPDVGSFNIDNTNGVILLSELFYYDYLIIEYVATPTVGEEYVVPMQFKEAMIAYLGWKDLQFVPSSRRGNLGDKRDRKHDFYNERRLAKARYKPLHLAEAYEWNLENQRMCVKS